MKFLLKILDFVFLLRPTLLIPVWLFMALGFTHSLQAGGEPFPVVFLPPLNFILAWLSFTMLIGAVYVANQIFDIEGDRENEKLFILPKGAVLVRTACIYTGVLVAASLAIAWFINLPYFIVAVLSAILGVLYTVPPFHFKGRAILDALSNGIGNGLLNTAAGWAAVAALDWRFALYTAPYVPAVMAVFLLTAIPDLPGDREAGEKTTPVVFGGKVTAWAALGLMALSLLLAVIFSNTIAGMCAVGSLPFFVVAVVKMEDRFHILAYRFATLFYAVIAAIFNPWLLVPVVGSVLLAKFYYHFKWQFKFPF